jgi:hypothetical protein
MFSSSWNEELLFPNTDGWTLVSGVDGYTQCGGIFLKGGYNMYGAGAYIYKTISFTPHYKIKIMFNFWKIDSWNIEQAILKVDGI